MFLVLSKSAVHANSPLVSAQFHDPLSEVWKWERKEDISFTFFSANLSTDAVGIGHLGPHSRVEHALSRDVHISFDGQGPGHTACIDPAESVTVTKENITNKNLVIMSVFHLGELTGLTMSITFVPVHVWLVW